MKPRHENGGVRRKGRKKGDRKSGGERRRGGRRSSGAGKLSLWHSRGNQYRNINEDLRINPLEDLQSCLIPTSSSGSFNFRGRRGDFSVEVLLKILHVIRFNRLFGIKIRV